MLNDAARVAYRLDADLNETIRRIAAQDLRSSHPIASKNRELLGSEDTVRHHWIPVRIEIDVVGLHTPIDHDRARDGQIIVHRRRILGRFRMLENSSYSHAV